jgi:hypothetical protein
MHQLFDQLFAAVFVTGLALAIITAATATPFTAAIAATVIAAATPTATACFAWITGVASRRISHNIGFISHN